MISFRTLIRFYYDSLSIIASVAASALEVSQSAVSAAESSKVFKSKGIVYLRTTLERVSIRLQ